MSRRALASTLISVALLAGLLVGNAIESRAGSEPLVDVVFIATGANYPDALAVAAATGGKGPILLVQQDQIPIETGDELERLHPKRIVIVGGTAVISETVANLLAGYTAGPVDRLFGSNRYATAAAISSEAFPTTGSASCAGRSFMPDTAGITYDYSSGRRTGGSPGGNFSCPVALPDGVTVTSVQFTVYDNASGSLDYVVCYLQAVDVTGAPSTNAGRGSTSQLAGPLLTGGSDTPGVVELVDSSISNPVVDNSRYAYWFTCFLGPDGNVGVYGGIVEYRG